ncbi:molybdate-binding protein [Dietzia sp. NCCP-2495]|uniref:molybdate ABC transporter substrate-binding protein n=1 Tax=Dietzia sp. NCCP-2495 TaxID=2934675 RepID=UPI00222EF0CB|nr:substrate-binding domain-containing protein [Dietzia sp. NCCP-2495]GLB64440.1 molybdate-binding protein [Dietzia sp. NCCP-2495]
MSVALVCAGSAGCAATDVEPTPETVTIGVAAAPSLAEAFTEIITAFEAEHPNVTVSMELGRSHQIAEGLSERTDINIFASANEESMATAEAEGTVSDPTVFARNHVVVAVPSGNPLGVASLADFAREGVRVGLCDPTVPCGRAGDTLLSEANIVPTDVTRSPGSRALTSRLADNRVDVGIVYRTDVASSRGWVTQAEVSEVERELARSAGTTRYVLARVPAGDAGEAARSEATASDEFVDLVLSSRGRTALLNSGLEAIPG